MAKVNDTPATTKRPRKSAEQKAIAELDAAIKTRDAAKTKLDKLKEGLAPSQTAFDKAEARVQFLQQNPDLPEDRRVTGLVEPANSEDTSANPEG